MWRTKYRKSTHRIGFLITFYLDYSQYLRSHQILSLTPKDYDNITSHSLGFFPPRFWLIFQRRMSPKHLLSSWHSLFKTKSKKGRVPPPKDSLGFSPLVCFFPCLQVIDIRGVPCLHHCDPALLHWALGNMIHIQQRILFLHRAAWFIADYFCLLRKFPLYFRHYIFLPCGFSPLLHL